MQSKLSGAKSNQAMCYRVTNTVLELLDLDLVLYTGIARTIIGHFHNITGIVQFKLRQ